MHALAAQVAIEAADIVLTGRHLAGAPAALHLAAATFARIQLNYFFAVAYNIAMVPAAAGAWYPVARVQARTSVCLLLR